MTHGSCGIGPIGRKVARGAAIALLAPWLGGCFFHTTRAFATDGGEFDAYGPGGQDQATARAATASAAHDLECPVERVSLVTAGTYDTANHEGRLMVVDGCGKRVSYSETCALPSLADNTIICRYLLLGVTPAGAARSP